MLPRISARYRRRSNGREVVNAATCGSRSPRKRPPHIRAAAGSSFVLRRISGTALPAGLGGGPGRGHLGSTGRKVAREVRVRLGEDLGGQAKEPDEPGRVPLVIAGAAPERGQVVAVQRPGGAAPDDDRASFEQLEPRRAGHRFLRGGDE